MALIGYCAVFFIQTWQPCQHLGLLTHTSLTLNCISLVIKPRRLKLLILTALVETVETQVRHTVKGLETCFEFTIHSKIHHQNIHFTRLWLHIGESNNRLGR